MNLCECFYLCDVLSREIHMKAAVLISQTWEMCSGVYSSLPPQSSHFLPLPVQPDLNAEMFSEFAELHFVTFSSE